jgi:Fur family transcriptional regulator, ferric uptake regulator
MQRQTKQREAIEGVLQVANRPLLAAEVLELAQKTVPSLGIATVYRTLKHLVQDRGLQVVEIPGNNPRYEFAQGHHHHFRCDVCQKVFDVHACPGDLAKLVPSGFEIHHHELTLYGRCASC